MDHRAFTTLIDYLEKVPAIRKPISFGDNDGHWWLKFSLNIDHKLAWNVVQEFGHVINYLSLNERLPTVFYPVSPPPYMNGGPFDFLSWVIETKDKDFKPGTLMKWLEGRLPRPVDDLEQWGEE
ncbi:hypothetical protein [Carboxylicivirga sp. RSCT41]|uniref:hypothetical protein n=1 Tax=Carboxylicivirga agarovorans TaxID=3417570 RepID=UPI003D33E905